MSLDSMIDLSLDVSGEVDLDTGHFLCTNPYQVLNDLNKFDQDKYLGEILKKHRQARAQKITYDVNLLHTPVKENEILRPQVDPSEISYFEDYCDVFFKCPITPSSLKVKKSVTSIICKLRNDIDSNLNKLDHFDSELGKNILYLKLGQKYEPLRDEICIWQLNRKQLSKGHNGDADDTVYYYLTSDAHVDDYFYSSHTK